MAFLSKLQYRAGARGGEKGRQGRQENGGKGRAATRPHAAAAAVVMSILLTSFVVAAASGAALPSASAAEPAGSFEDSVLAWGLEAPTAMAFAPDGRLFVAERSGDVRIIRDGALLEEPFLSLPVDHVCCERGLLGITLDPGFSANGLVYVYYTTAGEPIHNRVSRFASDPANPDVALAGSEAPILDLEPLAPNFHNGGAIHFGGDGKLYVAVGDNLVSENSQSLATRLGKMLRINADGTIPEDNPFYYVEGAKKEVWALGLRNPYSFAFSQDGSRMYINDVGRDSWEEVNAGAPGANYGWPWCEGPCSAPGLADPVHAYSHDGGAGMAVTGGAFYDGGWATQFPEEYRDSYFFGDYVAGFIKRLPMGGSVPAAVDFLQNAPTPLDIDVGPDGSLYYLSYSHGSVHRVQYVAPEVNGTPQAVLATATPAFGELPLEVEFDASQSSDPDGDPLFYSWDFGDGSEVQEGGGATATHTYASEGRYSAKVVVSDGRGGTASAEVGVVAGDNPPAARIESPAPGTKYSAGDMISFAGAGYDDRDGELPDSAFRWEVLLHHNTHTHPFLQFDGVRSGNFTVPRVMEVDHDVWFGVRLTVVDSAGLAGASAVDVHPNKVTVTVDSSVPGAAVSLDGGQPQATPFSFTGVAGVTRTLQAPAEVMWAAEGGESAARRYAFSSWSDGAAGSGSPARALDTPDADMTIVANYAFVPATLTVASADMDGNPVPGMWAAIVASSSPAGDILLQAGPTPHVLLEADPDAGYAVTVQDYGGMVFDHWEDGSTDRTRTVSNLVSDATLTAYYDTGSTLRGFTSLTHAGAAPGQPGLTVNAALVDGGGPLGMWAIIDAHPDSGAPGSATYTVYASEYPGLVFDRWEDDDADGSGTGMVRTLTIGEDTTLTAYYGRTG